MRCESNESMNRFSNSTLSVKVKLAPVFDTLLLVQAGSLLKKEATPAFEAFATCAKLKRTSNTIDRNIFVKKTPTFSQKISLNFLFSQRQKKRLHR